MVVIITEIITYLIKPYIEFEFILKFAKESKDVNFNKFILIIYFFKFNIIKNTITTRYTFNIFAKFATIS